MNTRSTVFLAQSYMDTWDDYNRSLMHAGFPCWDFVILTASNEQQAEGFRVHLAERDKAGMLPARTHFAVIPDPDGKRVGSGGATLGVLRYLAEYTGKTDFSGMRVLVIHSGGDSKRVPQYSALGKLFSPVPRELPNGRISTLFDEMLIGTASLPLRIREGMLLLSGDVLLLFNPLQIDYAGEGAAAISFKENVETGKNHGVFLRGEDGYVKRFLHKQTVESLTKHGAVNENGAVDIDTGAVIFSTEMMNSLYGLICDKGLCSEASFKKYVNETVRLSLYGDFLYPLAADATLEDYYQEKPEGEYCDALTEARTAVWKALRGYRMKLLRLAPAKFIHFGTTHEILQLMSAGIDDYSVLGWKQQVGSSVGRDIAGYNSVVSGKAQVGNGCYIEVSYVHSGASVGSGTLLSYVDIHEETVPANVVMHGLKQKDGRFVVRIYGVGDNPKASVDNCSFLGTDLQRFIDVNHITPDELWDDGTGSLWTAKLYPACTNIREAVGAALNLYEMAHGRGDIEAWRNADRCSLCSGFNDADPYSLIAWDKRMRELVLMDRLAGAIAAGEPAEKADALLKSSTLTKIQREWLDKRMKTADFSEIMRLYYYIGSALGGAEGEKYIRKCFAAIREEVLGKNRSCYNENCRIVHDSHIVKLPLRVNWGGGWSDTPPYCMEKGGTVLNAAISLGGELPVEVRLERLDEHRIVFDSRDMDAHGEFDDIAELQNTGDPYDPFALQKAALIACGIIPESGGTLEDILTRLGGGFIMHSEVVNVPKGSGLGTSSILSAACVKALLEFVGTDYELSDVYSYVLKMEQIMATGGGWQDQVGGLTPGIKYITAYPGSVQKLNVACIDISENTKAELNDRFALIYTGQRRLARNLLRDVVGKYLGNDADAVYALNEIQRTAALMRFELERGHVQDFAALLDRNWELVKMLDSGSSNTLIEQIFASIDDMIDGRMVCGAGGGGFLQVIMKPGVRSDDIHRRLKEVFQDSAVDIWDVQLLI